MSACSPSPSISIYQLFRIHRALDRLRELVDAPPSIRRARTLTAVASKPGAYTDFAESIQRTARPAAQSTLGRGCRRAQLSSLSDRSVMPLGHARKPGRRPGVLMGALLLTLFSTREALPSGRVCVPSTRTHRKPSNRPVSAPSLHGEQLAHRVAPTCPQHPNPRSHALQLRACGCYATNHAYTELSSALRQALAHTCSVGVVCFRA